MIVASDLDLECLASLHAIPPSSGRSRGRIATTLADATRLPFADASFDVVTARAVLQFISDRQTAVSEAYRVLRPGGRFSNAEPINRYMTPHHELIPLEDLGSAGAAVRSLFEAVYADPDEPMLTFDERDLEQHLTAAGFVEVGVNLLVHWERQDLTPDEARARVTKRGVAVRPSVEELISQRLGAGVAAQYVAFFAQRASAQPLLERRGLAFVWGRKP
jgi:SAM-dependent methyltransferase